MSEKITLDIDITEAERKIAELNAKVQALEARLSGAETESREQEDTIEETEVKLDEMVENVETEVENSEQEVIEMMQDSYDKQAELVEDVKEEAVRSFNEVMGFMRASYLMISGVSRILGGEMSQVFSYMYSVGVSAIGTYKAIAAAMAASGPAGWVQATLMMMSLTTATSSLISILAGQRELSTKIRGINMSLHGISALIGSVGFQ